ncbi:hypothetical protein FOCC_FOCC001407, partial [Frankliniella occidentalis]
MCRQGVERQQQPRGVGRRGGEAAAGGVGGEEPLAQEGDRSAPRHAPQ